MVRLWYDWCFIKPARRGLHRQLDDDASSLNTHLHICTSASDCQALWYTHFRKLRVSKGVTSVYRIAIITSMASLLYKTYNAELPCDVSAPID